MPFDEEPSSAPFPALPPRPIIRLALRLRRALHAAAAALAPPEVRVFELATGVAATKLLAAAAQHRIADRLLDGPSSAQELAERCDVDADALHRTLRALCYLGVFRLGKDGRFAHNRLSRALIGGALGRSRDACQYIGSPSNVRAWNDFAETLRT